VTKGLPQHVESPVIVEHEMLEDDWSDDELCLLGFHEVVNFGVHQSEPLADMAVSVLHGNESIASGPQNPHQLRQSVRVDLTRGKPYQEINRS